MNVEKWLEKRYITNFMKQVNDMDRSGIHVTELTSECLRKIWYGLKLKELYVVRELTIEQARIFWLGKKYHEVPLSNVAIKDDGSLFIIGDDKDVKVEYNEKDGLFYVYDLDGRKIGVYGFELPVQYYGVKGQIDEVVMTDEGLMIVDKKTTSWMPSAPAPNYMKQVEYYSVMLKEDWGLEAKFGAILYIQKLNGKNNSNSRFTKAYIWQLRPFEEIDREFKEKVDAVRAYLDKDELPPANQNKTDCRFCQWKTLCYQNSKNIELVRKKEESHIKTLDEFGWGKD